jgi:hypothetical protein
VNEIDTEPPTATDDGDTLDTTIDGPTTSPDPLRATVVAELVVGVGVFEVFDGSEVALEPDSLGAEAMDVVEVALIDVDVDMIVSSLTTVTAGPSDWLPSSDPQLTAVRSNKETATDPIRLKIIRHHTTGGHSTTRSD